MGARLQPLSRSIESPPFVQSHDRTYSPPDVNTRVTAIFTQLKDIYKDGNPSPLRWPTHSHLKPEGGGGWDQLWETTSAPSPTRRPCLSSRSFRSRSRMWTRSTGCQLSAPRCVIRWDELGVKGGSIVHLREDSLPEYRYGYGGDSEFCGIGYRADVVILMLTSSGDCHLEVR